MEKLDLTLIVVTRVCSAWNQDKYPAPSPKREWSCVRRKPAEALEDRKGLRTGEPSRKNADSCRQTLGAPAVEGGDSAFAVIIVYNENTIPLITKSSISSLRRGRQIVFVRKC